MSIPYPAQREDEQLEWIGGSIFSVALAGSEPALTRNYSIEEMR